MLRRLMLLLGAGLIAGCATTYEYYGDERYAQPVDGYATRGYDDSYRDDSYYDAGAYSGSYTGSYGGTYGYAGSAYRYDDWYEYPAYYSMFWSLNRWYVDPFWHPNFYYGVTWFPRSYFDVSFRYFPRYAGVYWPPYYRYVPYAPYRGAWVDHYYDWTPWYVHHPHIRHHYAPRYGNVRYEADRLSDWSRNRGSYERWRDEDRRIRRYDEPRALGEVRDRRESYRGANPGGSGSGRIDPQVRGFDSQRGVGGRDPRSMSGSRSDPGVRGFSAPQERTSGARAPAQGRLDPRLDPRDDLRAATPRDRDSIREDSISARSAYRAPPSAETARGARVGSDKPVYAPRAPVERSQRPQTERAQVTPRTQTYEVTRVPTPRNEYRRPSSDPGRPASTDRARAAPRDYATSPRVETPAYRAPPREARPVERDYAREAPTPRSYSAPTQPSYQAPARSYREPTPSAPRQQQYESRSSRPEPRVETAPRYERPAAREERAEEDRGGRGRGRSQDE